MSAVSNVVNPAFMCWQAASTKSEGLIRPWPPASCQQPLSIGANVVAVGGLGGGGESFSDDAGRRSAGQLCVALSRAEAVLRDQRSWCASAHMCRH